MAKRIVVKLTGIIFKNKDGTKRQDLLIDLYENWYTEGKQTWVKLKLIHEPDNEHDPNAIGVWCVKPKLGQLGHVPRNQAKVLASRLHMIEKVELVNMKCANKGGISATLHLKVKNLVKDTEGREYEI